MGFEGKEEKERDRERKAAGVHHSDDSRIHYHYSLSNSPLPKTLLFHILLPPNPSSKPAKRTTNNNK